MKIKIVQLAAGPTRDWTTSTLTISPRNRSYVDLDRMLNVFATSINYE